MGTALQKPWMRNLPQPIISLAKKKAVEATKAWDDTVSGILKASRAVHEVHEKIGGNKTGTFSAWAEEEFGRSRQTASQLAVIGSRFGLLDGISSNLPPAWSTLYELAKAPEGVFRRAIRRVKPDMDRNEIVCLLVEEAEEEEAPPPVKRTKAPSAKRAVDAPAEKAPEPTKRQAANLTIAAGSVWRLVKDFSAQSDEALAAGVLSPEAKKFMVHNYLDPAIELLTALKAKVEKA